MYRIWDSIEKRFRDNVVVSPMGNFLILDSIDSNTVCYYGGRDYKRFIVEQGFKVGDQVFYEGDIVEYINNKFKVIWKSLSWCLIDKNNWLISVKFPDVYNYKLVGNIHENPKLLRKLK